MGAYRVKLPDNSEKVFEHQPSFLDVAASIGKKLAQDALGGLITGDKEVRDVRSLVPDGAQINIVTSKHPKAAEVIRHTAAHVLAEAVQDLWPEVKVTIGPVIENGFFYDFDSPRTFLPEDLEKIEARMKEILKRNESVIREEWPIEKAIATFEGMGEHFKVEIIRDLQREGEKVVSIYHQGKWFDLCRGPHVQRTGQIRAIKVLHTAGAYWRGDENNKQLQRIYATAFASDEELKEYLHNLEEAKKRDHRKLGKELGLVHFHPLAPASPFFTGKGAIIYNELQQYIREKYFEYGYEEVISPQIFDIELFHQSGHYANYRDNMYFTKVEEREFGVKPMNCPGHCLLYGASHYSYRDLPIRMADFGRLHRFEKSGAVHGLNRVRTFSQDDAHIFCRIDQIQVEIQQFLKFLSEVYAQLGLGNYKIYFSTRPEQRMGAEKNWDAAEAALEQALTQGPYEYELNPGDGAFYGPKLDIMFVDALKRPWQLGTIQCDFNLPEAFGLGYIGEDNAQHRPVMLHRAILGSLERFIGVYLEHTAGSLPTWLSPLQVEILIVTERQAEYGRKLEADLRKARIRAHLDDRSEKLGFKIREAQLAKAPYMLIIGDEEMSKQTISVRLRQGKTIKDLSLEEFTAQLLKEIRLRSLGSSWSQNNNEGE